MKLFYLVLFMCMSMVWTSHAQKENHFSQFDTHVQEVYQDQADALVYSNPTRLAVLKDLYENRLFLAYDPAVINQKGAALNNTAQLPVMTKYGYEAQRLSNPGQLNPLQFQINYYLTQNQYFRIGNSDYLLVVKAFVPNSIQN